jgi:hypothetical protein
MYTPPLLTFSGERLLLIPFHPHGFSGADSHLTML